MMHGARPTGGSWLKWHRQTCRGAKAELASAWGFDLVIAVVMCARSAVARLAARPTALRWVVPSDGAPPPVWPLRCLWLAAAWGVGGLGSREDRDGGGKILGSHGRKWGATALRRPPDASL